MPRQYRTATTMVILVGWMLAIAPSAIAQGSSNNGEYLMRAADCMACHTRPGGTPFAGGREVGTPFGTISSPNITPDPDTGIGRWTDDQFVAALRDGIGRHREYLYPVMPYTSYARMTRADVLAIKSYLFTLKPVFAPRAPSGIGFPFDIRASLVVWRELYFRPGEFRPDPARSAEWNRGAYLVTGPAHCGECHSPRTILGGTEASRSLSGGAVQNWRAPNISSDPLAGLGDKSMADVVAFLKTGANKKFGVAFGPMAEVVHDSLAYLNAADLNAMAVYLKDSPDRARPAPLDAASAASIVSGQKLYVQNCSACHQDNGRGIPGAVANLAGNAAISAAQPNNLVLAVLKGLTGTGGYGSMPGFAGALNDREVADLANYVRTAWGNRGAADTTPAIVASVRAGANVGLGGTDAAREFECPKVGSGIIPGALATPEQVARLASGTDTENQMDAMIAATRAANPDGSVAVVVNTLNAAYCPAIANAPGMDNAARRAALARFNQMVLARVLGTQPALYSAAERVLITAPLPSPIADLVNNAAAAERLTPGQWIARLVTKSFSK